MSTFAERLKYALNLKKMSQADITKKTGIGKSSISTYLTGEYEPKQKNTYKLAKALNVNEAWLMGFDVDMERKENTEALSDKELFLINNFRDLNEQGQDYILQTMDLVKDKYKKSDSPSVLEESD